MHAVLASREPGPRKEDGLLGAPQPSSAAAPAFCHCYRPNEADETPGMARDGPPPSPDPRCFGAMAAFRAKTACPAQALLSLFDFPLLQA